METVVFVVLIAAAAVVAGLIVGARLAARDVAAPAPVDHLALEEALRHMSTVLASERERQGDQLDHKKELIDGSLGEMRAQLAELTRVVGSVERDRQRSFGELNEQLRAQTEGVAALTSTTRQLREALANVKVRGQWGERMADDVLRLAGLVEGINYRKQRAVHDHDGNTGIPDFTFFMPNARVLHMDVKFPVDNYLRYLEASNEFEQRTCRDAFLKDVRARVKELHGRGYLDRDDALDCLLLFIPNEAVYAFVNEHDPAIVESALRDRIVICSPLTLYAVLAVVRQAVENFALERRATEILDLLADFEQQWTRYVTKLDKLQRGFATVHKDYNELMTTRTRGLQRPLDRIAELRGGDALSLVDDDTLAVEA